MITDEQLHAAIGNAGEELPVPTGGPGAILEAALADGTSEGSPPAGGPGLTPRRRRPRPRVMVLSGGAVAAAAVALGLILSSSPTTGGPGVAVSPTVLGRPSTGVNDIGGAAKSPTAAFGSLGNASTPTPSRPGPTTAGKQPAKVTSSGTLALVIDRKALDKDVRALADLAASAGGYVANTNLSQASRTGKGAVVLSVPAATFQSVISSAERLGTLASLTTSNKDVTSQYTDTAAQIQALQAVRAQLETLLKRAAKVSDLLDVENQIQSVQTQIDELTGEQRVLNSQITYAQLTVNLKVKSAPRPAAHHKSALERAWDSAVSGFLGGLRWLLSISGGLLFAVLVGVIVLFGVRGFIRHLLPRVRRLFL